MDALLLIAVFSTFTGLLIGALVLLNERWDRRKNSDDPPGSPRRRKGDRKEG